MFKNRNTDNPKLKGKRLQDGRESLYLAYYLGYTKLIHPETGQIHIRHERKKESLKLYLLPHPKTARDKERNQAVMELAKQIRYERELQLKEQHWGKKMPRIGKEDFYDFASSYIERYDKKDKAVVRGAVAKFQSYMQKTYPVFGQRLKTEYLSPEMVKGFVDYLNRICRGSGANSYYARFKKVVRHAAETGCMGRNPCQGIYCKTDRDIIRKEILSPEEVLALASTEVSALHTDIKRGFLFSLYTGIRFCDLKRLRFSNIDYANRTLKFEQAKTKGYSRNSWVSIPLNDTHFQIIGNKGNVHEPLFRLPAYSTCKTVLRAWVKKTGIEKHITWHCARHSFAVFLLNSQANIKTVSELLGHSSLAMTEKYLHATDRLKKEAIDRLPSLTL